MAGCGGGIDCGGGTTPFCCDRGVGAGAGGFISIGGTLSIAGRGAQGDLAGVDVVGLETSVGFSVGVFKTRGVPGLSAAERGLRTVAFGPTVVVGFFSNAAFAFFSAS